jgi:hypothetical protein
MQELGTMQRLMVPSACDTGVPLIPAHSLRCTGFRHGGLAATRFSGLGFQLEAARHSEFRRVSQRFA